MPDNLVITRDMLDQLRVECAAKIRMSEESGVPRGVAYVGLHPALLGKLIDIAEEHLREQEQK